MIKVFLVEDETIIRRSIKRNVEWEKNGFEFVGEAGDGEYAYPQILKIEPDILITDIKMPFMDGLELSRLVKKALPKIKIIVLSGYNEFDYAKEAIKIGISDYLLKPVTSAGLTEALKKAAEAVKEEREKTKLLERYFVSYEKYNEFLDKTDYSGVDRKLVEEFLKLGSLGEEEDFVEEYFAAVGENNYKSLLLRQYMTMDIFFCMQEFLKSINAKTDGLPEEFSDIKFIPKAVSSVENTKEYLKELLHYGISERDKVSNNRYGTLIDEAKRYIGEEFYSNEFSLNMIAAHIGVSPSYFSSIFKQETGQSFVEYLTKVRIEKACELLKCTTLKTSEIGEKVGYNDPHYFSATFKKVTGMSPKEYKNGI
ncbi:helix-turn-helix domain-containing protein [Lachnospiraceae bacterium 62-35]